MSQRILIAALTLLSAGLGIYAYRQSGDVIAAETRLRAIEAKIAQSPKAEVTPAPTAPTVDRMPPSQRNDRPAQPAVTPTPEAQRLMNLRDRSILDTQYADLFKHLALPPEQLQKLQHLLLGRRSIFTDVMAEMRNKGIAATQENAQQIQALVDYAVAETELQIKTTLGDDAYSRYKQYEATQMERRTATRVQQRLSYSPEPLTEQQFSRLVEALAGDGQSAGSGAALSQAPGGKVPLPRITSAVLDRARAFLSPAQMDGLQQIQMEQDASLQLARQTGGG